MGLISHPISASIGPMPVHGNLRLDDKAEILSAGQRGDERDGTDRAPGIDMEQNVSAVVVALDVYLEQLKERCVLRDELVSESRRLGCWVSGGSCFRRMQPLIS